MRTSLSQDDSDYYTLKFQLRLGKCRLRARIYSLLDLGYTLVRFLVLIAVFGFQLRTELRRAQLRQDQLTSLTNGQDQDHVTITATPTPSAMSIQWLAHVLLPTLCSLLQLIASVLLCCSAAAKPSSSPSATLPRFWIALNLITVPYAVYKILTGNLLFLLELGLKLVGAPLVYDLIVFTTAGAASSSSSSGGSSGKGIEGEEEPLELPNSIGSCLFGKSCCVVLDQCC